MTFICEKLSKVKTEYVWCCEMLQFYSWCEKIHLGYLVQFCFKIGSSSTCRQYKCKYICCLLMESKFKLRKHRRLVWLFSEVEKLFLKVFTGGHSLFLSSFKLRNDLCGSPLPFLGNDTISLSSFVDLHTHSFGPHPIPAFFDWKRGWVTDMIWASGLLILSYR